MAKFSAAQRARINRKSKFRELTPDEAGGELNIVPFLDIIMNILLFILATIATVFTATIPIPAPHNNNGPAQAGPERLNLTVIVLPNGYKIGARGGFLDPGCRTVGQAPITVPALGAADADGYTHDFASLTQCMTALRVAFHDDISTADEHSINITINGDIPYGVLVRTIDAVREDHEGACRMPEGLTPGNYTNANCMFPEVTLGVLRN